METLKNTSSELCFSKRKLIEMELYSLLDETYVKVKGKWHYLYYAINKQGETLDFYFCHKPNKEAAY